MSASLLLKNPHSVFAALENRPKDVLQISIGGGKPSDQWSEVIKKAQSCGVKVRKNEEDGDQKPPRDFKKNHKPQKFEREGGFSALIKPKDPVPLKELFSENEKKVGRLWIALDQIQDPHNVGAIFRTASFFGCEGILMTEDRAASLTGTVYDVSSGGVELLPFAIETNLIRSLETAKENFDVWTIGTSEHAKESLTTLPRDRNWILVLGNEESGLRTKVQEECDYLVSIPPVAHERSGGITSLNVSVAMGVFSFYLKSI